MLISFEGQAFSNNSKTGVAWYAYNIIKNAIELDRQNQFQINIFRTLRQNGTKQKNEELFLHCNNVKVKTSDLLPYGLYIRYHKIFGKLNYENFFGTRPDVSCFFNFVLPSSIKAKTINTIHDLNYILYPETMNKVNYNIHKKNLKRSCEQADIIIAVSENGKREIADYMNVSKDKIKVVYNAVDHKTYFPKKDEETIRKKYDISSPYILYLGTLEPRKNIISIIKSFNIVASKNKDINLVLAGPKGWMYKEIFNLVKELKLQERITFTGYIDEQDKPALYSCATAFVFPSLYEGFGIPPLEAMACGTPVIVSNTASLPEVVGDAGILVDPHDIENIAYEMDRLINDTSLRKQCSEKGLIQAQKFSWEDSARKVIEIYNSLA